MHKYDRKFFFYCGYQLLKKGLFSFFITVIRFEEYSAFCTACTEFSLDFPAFVPLCESTNESLISLPLWIFFLFFG